MKNQSTITRTPVAATIERTTNADSRHVTTRFRLIETAQTDRYGRQGHYALDLVTFQDSYRKTYRSSARRVWVTLDGGTRSRMSFGEAAAPVADCVSTCDRYSAKTLEGLHDTFEAVAEEDLHALLVWAADQTAAL